MKIRFKAYVESDVPGFPFRPGQVIDVAEPTPQILALLDAREDGSHAAEVVRDEPEGELAVAMVAPDRAVTRGPRRADR